MIASAEYVSELSNLFLERHEDCWWHLHAFSHHEFLFACRAHTYLGSVDHVAAILTPIAFLAYTGAAASTFYLNKKKQTNQLPQT